MGTSTKHILISGAFGGIGQATMIELLKSDWHIFAVDIHPEIPALFKNTTQITPLVIDVRDTHSIEKAFDLISCKTDGLDAIISMTGILKVGSLAELPLDDLKQVMEINLYGMYEINKRFLPLVIARKGRIITLSSEVGTQMAAPFNGFYSMSKHAVEAYSDALRRELAFIGIKVIKIQPGPFKTSMTKNAENQFIEAEKESLLFKKNIAKGIPYLPKVYKNANEPVLVAQCIISALNDPYPKIAYAIKKDRTRQILDLLPVRWADWMIKRALS